MWHKPCRTFHPWCLCIKTRCLWVHVMSPLLLLFNAGFLSINFLQQTNRNLQPKYKLFFNKMYLHVTSAKCQPPYSASTCVSGGRWVMGDAVGGGGCCGVHACCRWLPDYNLNSNRRMSWLCVKHLFYMKWMPLEIDSHSLWLSQI